MISILERLFDLEVLPSDHGQARDSFPRFFGFEHHLILPSALLIMVGLTIFGLIVLELAGFIEPVNSALLFWSFAAVPILLGLGGFAAIQGLLRRRVTQEQFLWMQEAHKDLEMPEPSRGMRKLDLVLYVDKAYSLQSQHKRYI